MTQQGRRLVERIVDPAYLEGLADRSLEELRAMRDECREGENELSFERRLCQGRVDILSAELERREGSRDSDLLERLPEILASEIGPTGDSPLPERAPDFSVPRNVDVPRRRVEEIVGEQTIARLANMTTDEIRAIISSLARHESEVSARRKRVQEVVDAVQDEIVRRYVSGQADPTAALK
ncbi:MAG: ABC transporter substrate-binding protein [Actinomycetota bacterium]